MPGRTKIFLSPHFDDVALSCGGIVAMAAAAGQEACIVTVCGALPPRAATSALTDKVHRSRGFADGVAYVSARREEDRAAAAVLGAKVEWGASLDAIYRRPDDYRLSSALLGPPDPADPLLAETTALIADLRRRFPGATLFAPLGIGGHIDHRLIAAAARAAGGGICFYEEFPQRVRLDPQAIPGRPELTDIGPYVNQRIDAVLCYRSQIRPLFGGDGAARAAIIDHVASTGGERVWRV
jgi:LmbE family N-acetylglucosaminyl deacetylase